MQQYHSDTVCDTNAQIVCKYHMDKCIFSVILVIHCYKMYQV